MKHPLQTFEPNIEGRDFVIGDLHGAFPCFENLLKGLDFDPSKDRMFSVGDLVDRGPDSHKCLSLIREPWFHSVLSNHEQMMLHAFTGGPFAGAWFRNGGQWGLEAFLLDERLANKEIVVMDEDTYDIIDLQTLVDELPYMITVKMVDGRKYHILHAELPGYFGGNRLSSGDITDEMLEDPEIVRALATEPIDRMGEEAFLWERNLFYFFCRQQLHEDKVRRTVEYHFGKQNPFSDKLSHIISGHTIVQQPLTVLGQTNIDTCAYAACRDDRRAWEALTCIELGTWKFYQATPDEFREVKPMTVNLEGNTNETDQ